LNPSPRRQYQTLIANYEYDAEREEREVLNLLSYNIDGLILTGKLHTERMIQYVRASGVPVAELMDISGQYLDIQVGFDNEKAAFEMTQVYRQWKTSHCVLWINGRPSRFESLPRYRECAGCAGAGGVSPGAKNDFVGSAGAQNVPAGDGGKAGY
jgi:LacI family gluconate utilization system Gnt-II transcriptional activator